MKPKSGDNMDSVLLQQYAGITWKMWVCKIALQRDFAPATKHQTHGLKRGQRM